MKQRGDTPVVFELTKGIESGETRDEHNMKTFGGWGARVSISHDFNPP
jgi:hypothetical protein